MLKLLLGVALLGATPVLAAGVTFESGDSPATLVELFTSEGCSSCPPADAWLSKLKTSPDLWKRIVPVAFHVDYWNSLGWSDRFSNAANTARQRRYAAAWHGDSIYTPGFVLNGREWRGWFGGEIPSGHSPAKVGILTVTVTEGKAEVVFIPTGTALPPTQVELALLGSNLESNVSRGENIGRKLRHDFTVLHFVSMPLHTTANRLVAELPLPTTNAIEPSAIAAWVTPGEAQPPIQATGGWLPRR